VPVALSAKYGAKRATLETMAFPAATPEGGGVPVVAIMRTGCDLGALPATMALCEMASDADRRRGRAAGDVKAAAIGRKTAPRSVA
jgi:hypothetical protein